jgi:Glycosyl transferase family 2
MLFNPNGSSSLIVLNVCAVLVGMSFVNSRIGIVVIGRNEGDRLRRCLSSVDDTMQVVYVDSGSTDDSVVLARSTGAEVILLDTATSFTAARARNAGYARLRETLPDMQMVQFIDGDCSIAEGWIRHAFDYLSDVPGVAAVCGGLREQNPQASLYTRLGDYEWRKPIGEIEACGGIFMIRRAVFERVGGFDPLIAAGEEPNMCCRIRDLGLRIVRLDHAMAVHDLNMYRFSQWWRRSVRGGYGALNLTLFGPNVSRHVFRRQVISVSIWGVALPCFVVAGTATASVAGASTLAILFPLLGVCALAAQAVKMWVRSMRAGMSVKDAAAVGAFSVLWKFAAAAGFARCLLDRIRRSSRSGRLMPVRAFHKSD